MLIFPLGGGNGRFAVLGVNLHALERCSRGQQQRLHVRRQIGFDLVLMLADGFLELLAERRRHRNGVQADPFQQQPDHPLRGLEMLL